jgi:hypothetical protein
MSNGTVVEAPSGNKRQLTKQDDVVRLFTLFALFGGNTMRTAAVARVPEDRVKALAHDFDWKNKLAGRSRLDTDEGKEAEREVNRVANYVVADNLSKVFEHLITELGSDEMFARAFCTETDEDGEKHFNTKNLVELAKGLQIVADIKYRALGDKLAAAADTTNSMKGTANLAVELYDALQRRFDRLPVVSEIPARIIKAVEASNDKDTLVES